MLGHRRQRQAEIAGERARLIHAQPHAVLDSIADYLFELFARAIRLAESCKRFGELEP